MDLYFVSRGDGRHMFARTYKEHLHNIQLAHAMIAARADTQTVDPTPRDTVVATRKHAANTRDTVVVNRKRAAGARDTVAVNRKHAAGNRDTAAIMQKAPAAVPRKPSAAVPRKR